MAYLLNIAPKTEQLTCPVVATPKTRNRIASTSPESSSTSNGPLVIQSSKVEVPDMNVPTCVSTGCAPKFESWPPISRSTTMLGNPPALAGLAFAPHESYFNGTRFPAGTGGVVAVQLSAPYST